MSTIEKASEKLIEKIASLSEQSPKHGISNRVESDMAEAAHDQSGGIQNLEGLNECGSDLEGNSPTLTLNREKMLAHALLLPEMGTSPIAEQYRKIKQPLLRQINGNTEIANNLIMVSSSVEGEGKSYTSINLAISIAMELDHTALLIDVDSKKNAVSEYLGLPPASGLSDYLNSEDIDIKNIIYSTDIKDLKIIPSGTAELASTEAITSIKMKKFLEEISERYADRVIILDTPPLLVSAISKALTYMVDQVIMVVEAEKTPASAVTEAIEYINEKSFTGFILNKTNLATSTESQYGNYG